jgi:hypothetical protein
MKTYLCIKTTREYDHPDSEAKPPIAKESHVVDL